MTDKSTPDYLPEHISPMELDGEEFAMLIATFFNNGQQTQVNSITDPLRAKETMREVSDTYTSEPFVMEGTDGVRRVGFFVGRPCTPDEEQAYVQWCARQEE